VASAFRVVLITSPRGRKADSLARGLVKGRLAACVNVVPGVASHYRWKGRLLRDAEALLIVKTSAAKFPAIQRFLAKNHPYALPEMLALKVADGSKPYLRWLAGELK
jgi:periplasmic divalent cation tolerance protein